MHLKSLKKTHYSVLLTPFTAIRRNMTTLFENFLCNSVSVAAVQNQPAQGLGTPQNRPMTQKNRFFQSPDIDTPIQPRKKKHQTNISSALKKF